MSWYAVSLLFKAIHSSKSKSSPLWEERLLLVEADSEDQAKREGTRFGKGAEHEYEVAGERRGQSKASLRWTFDRVERIFHIEDERLNHGTELFSRYLRDSEAKSLLKSFDDD